MHVFSNKYAHILYSVMRSSIVAVNYKIESFSPFFSLALSLVSTHFFISFSSPESSLLFAHARIYIYIYIHSRGWI